MLRAIREIQPTFIVGENVFGLVNWNGGMVFNEVQADLETEGYEVTPFILPACAVNAPHRRDRIWFVAHSRHKNGGRLFKGKVNEIQDSNRKTTRRFNVDISEYWTNRAIESGIYNGDDGLSYILDGITFPKWRNESIKAGGNAIVPQIAHQLFLAIEKCNNIL